MKRRLTKISLLILGLLLCLPSIALADNSRFKITRVERDPAGHAINYYPLGLFRDGMHLASYGNEFFYISKEGKKVTFPNLLGRGFSGGLAPIYDENKGLGYIDTTGKVVIPMSLNVYKPSDYQVGMTGNFIDGKYTVVYQGPNYDSPNYHWEQSYELDNWYTIDRTGKRVNAKWTPKQLSDMTWSLEGIPSDVQTEKITIQGQEVTGYFNEGLSLVSTDNEYGHRADAWVVEDLHYKPERPEISDPIIVEEPGEKPSEPEEKPMPEVPFMEYSNLSKLDFIGWREFDDGHGINYKITNNSNLVDSGSYCLVVDSNRAEVHFIDYDNLQPGESIYGTIHTQTDGDHIMEKKVDTYISTFKNSQERVEFEHGIPWKVWSSEEYAMEDIDYCLDEGIKGVKWLNDNLGITE